MIPVLTHIPHKHYTHMRVPTASVIGRENITKKSKKKVKKKKKFKKNHHFTHTHGNIERAQNFVCVQSRMLPPLL